MWRDYKSKVIHNKQRWLGSAQPANLHEIGVEEKFGSAQKVGEGLEQKGGFSFNALHRL